MHSLMSLLQLHMKYERESILCKVTRNGFLFDLQTFFVMFTITEG